MATKAEWEAVKKQWGNKCCVCGQTEKKLGSLDKAHLKARSKGGSQLVPMCPNCHQRYDKKLLNKREAQKIGLDYIKYLKGTYSPRKSRQTEVRAGFW